MFDFVLSELLCLGAGGFTEQVGEGGDQNEPKRFNLNPIHQMPGLNTYVEPGQMS
jgi:hypothetical protein